MGTSARIAFSRRYGISGIGSLVFSEHTTDVRNKRPAGRPDEDAESVIGFTFACIE